MTRPGRPSKLTADCRTRLLQAIRLGATYEHACNYAGITYGTLRNWMAAGEDSTSGQYFDLIQDIKEAEGQAVAGWLAKIEKAANDGVWQAAAWKLERRYPHIYGRNVTEVAGDQSHSVTVTYVNSD